MSSRLAGLALIVAALALPGEAHAADPLPRFEYRHLGAAAQRTLEARLRRLPGTAKRLLGLLDGRLVVSRATRHDPGGGDVTYTLIDDHGTSFEIRLTPEHMRAGSRRGAFLWLHELGHAVENGLVTQRQDGRIYEYLASRPGWRACYPAPPDALDPCIPDAEIFADQFAFWATGLTDVRSAYGDGPLVERAFYTRLMARTIRHHQSLPL